MKNVLTQTYPSNLWFLSALTKTFRNKSRLLCIFRRNSSLCGFLPCKPNTGGHWVQTSVWVNVFYQNKVGKIRDESFFLEVLDELETSPVKNADQWFCSFEKQLSKFTFTSVVAVSSVVHLKKKLSSCFTQITVEWKNQKTWAHNFI